MSGQLAKFADFSIWLHESRYAKEMMFIRSHNRLLSTKLRLLKNLKKTLNILRQAGQMRTTCCTQPAIRCVAMVWFFNWGLILQTYTVPVIAAMNSTVVRNCLLIHLGSSSLHTSNSQYWSTVIPLNGHYSHGSVNQNRIYGYHRDYSYYAFYTATFTKTILPSWNS